MSQPSIRERIKKLQAIPGATLPESAELKEFKEYLKSKTSRSKPVPAIYVAPIMNEELYAKAVSKETIKKLLYYKNNSTLQFGGFEDIECFYFHYLISMNSRTVHKLDNTIYTYLNLAIDNLTDDMYMTTTESNQRLLELGTIPFCTAVAGDVIPTDDIWFALVTTGIMSTESPPQTVEDALSEEYRFTSSIHLESAFQIWLEVLEDHPESKIVMRRILLSMYINTFVSLSKMGNYTEEYSKNLISHLKDDVKIEVKVLKRSELQTIYSYIKSGLKTIDNVRVYVERLIKIVDKEGYPIRSKLVLQRAIFTGLTIYRCIYQVFQMESFPLDELVHLYPAEASRFCTAVKEIGEGQYYGFLTTENSSWRVKNYMNLGTACVDILSECTEATTLKHYMGAKLKKYLYRDSVKNIIAFYNRKSGRNPTNFDRYTTPKESLDAAKEICNAISTGKDIVPSGIYAFEAAWNSRREYSEKNPLTQEEEMAKRMEEMKLAFERRSDRE